MTGVLARAVTVYHLEPMRVGTRRFRKLTPLVFRAMRGDLAAIGRLYRAGAYEAVACVWMKEISPEQAAATAYAATFSAVPPVTTSGGWMDHIHGLPRSTRVELLGREKLERFCRSSTVGTVLASGNAYFAMVGTGVVGLSITGTRNQRDRKRKKHPSTRVVSPGTMNLPVTDIVIA
jgi:hypothetical protein